MKAWGKLKHNIERGKQGLNKGIPFEGFGTLSKYINNIQQGRYDAVFAGSSIGKSAFINNTYCYGAISYLQKNPSSPYSLEIIYYTLEITPENQLAKEIAARIWKDHGILTSVNEILSRGDNSLPPQLEKLIDSYESDMTEIESKYIFFKQNLEPYSFEKNIIKYAESRGKVIRNQSGEIIGYKPNNPNLITEIIIDHIGLINHSNFKNLKAAIDYLSGLLVKFRNLFNFSPVVIVQMNRSNEQMDRRGTDENWFPMLSDIKNTGNIGEDAETVIGIASPFYLQVPYCLGFDISKFKNRYRLVRIVKNRDGDSNISSSFLFIGEIGKYYQLGKPEEYVSGPPLELKRVNDFYRAKNEFDKG